MISAEALSLKITPSLKTSKKMLTSIDVKFIFDNACLSASLGYKGLFSSANIPQIVDVVRRVVFLPFLLCFSSQLANSSPISSS